MNIESQAATAGGLSSRIRWAIFIALSLVALAIRLPQLGARPMHTDESINAYTTGNLLAGETFHYDPQDRHGPALFALAEPLVKLLGARTFADLTETQLRLTPVIIGSATVLLLGAGVEMFGFIPCLLAALLFAFAPLPVYYSRYFIHETLFVAATLGLILAGWRALQKPSVACAALAGLCAALMLASKETAVIHFFALGVVFDLRLVAAAAREISPRSKWVAVALVAVFIFVAVLLFTSGLAGTGRCLPICCMPSPGSAPAPVARDMRNRLATICIYWTRCGWASCLSWLWAAFMRRRAMP